MSALTPERVRELLDGATPGPWRLSEGNPGEVWADRDPAGWDAFLVATTSTRLNPQVGEQGEADAGLIAAAPDLAQAYLDLTAEVERLRGPDRSATFLASHGRQMPGCYFDVAGA